MADDLVHDKPAYFVYDKPVAPRLFTAAVAAALAEHRPVLDRREILLCPFCHELITRAAPTYDETERAVYQHLLDRHPIRWRLHRRFRRAMRTRAGT